MYYYRHGEVIFASLLPDLPLEPAKRPSAGTPSLFLIDRDPIRSRSSFCVSDPRQLTAETEDVTWLDPSRMGVPVPSLPKRLQHTIDARLLRAVNIRHPRWADFTKAPAMHLPSRLRVNLLAVGDVGSTLLTALKLLGGDCIESIGICDLNQKTVARWVTEMEQVSWPWDYDALPAVWTPQEAHDADLLIVCLKYGALPGALDSIKAVTGPHTTIMSLMNGVDSEDIIASAVGGEHLLYSLIKVASHKEADGVHFDPATTVGIIFGEKEPPCDSPRVKAVEALFGGTELHFRATDCIREEMWSKFRLNVCNNLPQAILGAGVGCYRDSVHMKAISDGLRRELEAIAAAKGIDMQKVDAVSGKGCAVKPSARYSTLQDLDAGRHTEIDMFSGALIRMGKELGIPTPYNEFAYHMIKALEEKNDGKFDYAGPDQEMTWAR